MENAIIRAPIAIVNLLPALSMIRASRIVQPIFIVLSMPPASNDSRVPSPRALNSVGR